MGELLAPTAETWHDGAISGSAVAIRMLRYCISYQL